MNIAKPVTHWQDFVLTNAWAGGSLVKLLEGHIMLLEEYVSLMLNVCKIARHLSPMQGYMVLDTLEARDCRVGLQLMATQLKAKSLNLAATIPSFP